jgi:hypothetical protein
MRISPSLVTLAIAFSAGECQIVVPSSHCLTNTHGLLLAHRFCSIAEGLVADGLRKKTSVAHPASACSNTC